MEKHQKNGLLAFIFAILLSLNAGAVFASNPFFSDISKSYWGYSGVQWAVDNQVATGYPDGEFKPALPIHQNELLRGGYLRIKCVLCL